MNFSILNTAVHDADFLLETRMRKGYISSGKRLDVYLATVFTSGARYLEAYTLSYTAVQWRNKWPEAPTPHSPHPFHPTDSAIAVTTLAKLLSDRIIRKQHTAFRQKNEMRSEKTDDKV
jgi:hypothetical protein